MSNTHNNVALDEYKLEPTDDGGELKQSVEDFIKQDTDKPMVSLIEPKFILGIAEVLTFGAKKYEIDGWKKAKLSDMRRYKDALLRHTLAYIDGETIDPESGLSHLYHISCNTMFLDYFDRKGKL